MSSILTPRQQQLCDLLVAGHTVYTAGAAMGIAYSTARTLVRNARKHYGAACLSDLVAAHGKGAPYTGPYQPPRADGLTPAEYALFELAATGLAWSEICTLNHRTYNTLRRQTQQVYRKLGVRSRHAALIKLGLLKSSRVFAVQELSEPFEAEVDRAAYETDPRTLPYAGYET